MAGRPRTEISKDWLQAKVDSGLNDKEIASSLSHQGTSVSAKTIQRRRIEFGVRTKRRRLGSDTPGQSLSSSSSSSLSSSSGGSVAQMQFVPLHMSASLSDSSLHLRGTQHHPSLHHHLHHHRAHSFEDDESPRKIRSPSQTRTPSPSPATSSPSYPHSIPHKDSSSSPTVSSPSSIHHSAPMINPIHFTVAYNLAKSHSSPSLLTTPPVRDVATPHSLLPIPVSSSSPSPSCWLDTPPPSHAIMSPPSYRSSPLVSSPSSIVPPILSPPAPSSSFYAHDAPVGSPATSHPHPHPHPHPHHSESPSSNPAGPYTFLSAPRPLPSLHSLLHHNTNNGGQVSTATTMCSPEQTRQRPSPSLSSTGSPSNSRLNIHALLSNTNEADDHEMGMGMSTGAADANAIAWLSPVRVPRRASQQPDDGSPVSSIPPSRKMEEEEEEDDDNSSHNRELAESDLTLDKETAECARQLQRICTSQTTPHVSSPLSSSSSSPSLSQKQNQQRNQAEEVRPPAACSPILSLQQQQQQQQGRVSSIHSVLSMRN